MLFITNWQSDGNKNLYGDTLATSFYESSNVKSALAAASLYRTAMAAGKILLLSQKQTGEPKNIGGLQ